MSGKATATDLDPWRCAVCKARYVVPTLARDCEQKHEVRAKDGD